MATNYIPGRGSVTNLIGQLVRVFKALPESDIRGLQNDLQDVDTAADLWNSDPHRNPGPGENPVGPVVSASGSGASRAVEHYSPDSGHGDALVRQYDEMSRRMDALEKAFSGMASLVVQLVKSDNRFPVSETKDEDEDEDKRKEDEESDTAKGQIPTLSLGDMFATMAGKMRATRKASEKLRTPPYLGGPHPAMVKSSRIDEALASGDLSLSEMLDLQTLKARMQAAAEGKLPHDRVRAGLHHLPVWAG